MSPASRTRMLRAMACAVTLSATIVVAAGSGCGLRVGVAYAPSEYGDYPPDAYIATAEPVYFEGRASYWYGGRWYYRDGNRWGHYDREPAALRQRRAQVAPRQRTYEQPSRGRQAPAGHAAAPRPAQRPAHQR